MERPIVVFFATKVFRAVASSAALAALAACGAGGSSQSALLGNSANALGSTPAPATPAPFTVTGAIVSTSGSNFLIQAGAGCGYLNVVTSADTAIAANGQALTAGTYAQVWGSGSCATQVSASTVALASSSNGPFATPLPLARKVPGIPGSPTPTPAPTATPKPTTAPTAAPTAAPTTAPGTGTLSPSAFTSIVNGQAWPAAFRPYTGAPWNQTVATANVDAATTTRLGSYLNNVGTFTVQGDTAWDYGHPVYVASASDPVVSFNCSTAVTMYGCNQPFSSFHLPAKARPTGGSDHSLGVIQPDGTEYDFWLAQYSGGSTLTAAIGVVSSVYGSGIPTGFSATSGASLAAGVIRFDELNRGVIPHALTVVVPCTNGVIYPGTTKALECGDGNGIPVGTHIYLTLSDAQIDALPASTVPSYMLPIAHALHQYGAFVEDTYGGAEGTPTFHFEPVTQYQSFGQTYPGVTFAQAHGFSYASSVSQYSGAGLNWPALAPYLKVIQ